MARQTSYNGTAITDIVDTDPGILIFDSTTGDYAPAVAMRFQLYPGSSESVMVHIVGFHSQNDSVDAADWDKAVVGAGIPLDIAYRKEKYVGGSIEEVYAWSESGGGVLCWTPIAQAN